MHHRRVPDEGSGDGGSYEHQDTWQPPQDIGGEVRSRSCSVTFGHSFLEQLEHHWRVPDEGSGGHEYHDAREAPQATGEKGRSKSCSVTSGHSCLEQLVHHRRVLDESSGGHEHLDTQDPLCLPAGKVDRGAAAGVLTIHSWRSRCITGVFRTRATANGYGHQDTRDPPQAAGGKGRPRSNSVTFGHPFLQKPVHNLSEPS
ncbi:hypothetical protein [Paenibacillus elgii]|uniref:hypothetical protein n=1 Tax=Paenibacillus elgii TaxID=189691 RepID=UPI0013D60C73|nr:hypothetical protein [Paenibacillus elgii]